MKLLRILIVLLKIIAWGVVIAIPTIGVWVASSLAAYMNGPIWLACVAGLLLFPAIPIIWDIWASGRFAESQERRKAAGKEPRKRWVTFSDRLILRTLAVNLTFLAALLATFPKAGFTALATRGDWFLETTSSKTAQNIRPLLFKSAEGLTWLYELSMDNPYEKYQDDEPLPTPSQDEFGDTKTVTKTDKPTVDKPNVDKPNVDRPNVDKPDEPDRPPVIEGTDTDEPDVPEEPQRVAGEPPAWPMKAELHPLVKNMPASIETDYASVATYIKEHESDPFLRVKALNDYIDKRTAYDYPALRSGDFGPQSAKAVFDRKTAVCAGYARLLEAMGKVTGDEIVYIVGVSRNQDGEVPGIGHAWNAAKINGKWYLIDTTWNDGDFETGEDKYSTNYLFTPPAVFGQDHLPDNPEWQLRPDPITRGEFVRQPMLQPEFFAQGLELVTPKRSQVEARKGTVAIELRNPGARKVIAAIEPANSGHGKRCDVTGRHDVRVVCKVSHGTYRLKLFAGSPSQTTFPSVGQFEVTSR